MFLLEWLQNRFFFSLLSTLCICILSVNSFPCHQYICTVFTKLHVYKASGTIWFIQDKPITWSVKFYLCKTPKQLPKKQRPPSLKWKIFSVLLKHQKYYFPEKSHDSTGINNYQVCIQITTHSWNLLKIIFQINFHNNISLWINLFWNSFLLK